MPFNEPPHDPSAHGSRPADVLLNIKEPVALIAAANLMVVLHVAAAWQVGPGAWCCSWLHLRVLPGCCDVRCAALCGVGRLARCACQ